MMNQQEKSAILGKAKIWFRESIAEQHVVNTQKLGDPRQFNINPFLVNYLANYLTGNDAPESIAKVLILPRILGTSITTSFGTGMQRFASDVLAGFGSMIPGIDIEFEDQLDQRRKYCQIKAGPNTINKDDVESISGHFNAAKNLARTNNLAIGYGDFVVAILYGEPRQISGHYKRLQSQYAYNVLIGQEFWHRFTGDRHFYADLIEAIASVATEIDGTNIIDETVRRLANTEAIKRLASNDLD